MSERHLYPYYTIKGHGAVSAPVYSVQDTASNPVGLCAAGSQHEWLMTEEDFDSEWGRASEECMNCRLQRRWAP